MRQRDIALDVDDVLFPFVETFLDHHNRVYGTDIRPEHITGPYEAVFGLPPAGVGERIYGFHELDDLHIAPIADAQAAVEALAMRRGLHIITARHPKFEYRTRAWLAEHFPGAFRTITHIGYADLMPNPRTKAELCRKVGAVALVDDSASHVAGCAAVNIQGIRFGDYPYQQGKELPAGVVVCNDWKAVLEYFDGRDS